MAKSTKVQNDDSDSDGEVDLMDMPEQAHECLEMKRKECKELRKELKALKQSFDELNASHESLKEDHEELGKAHTKLEKAHSSLLDQGKKEVVLTCDVGSTCDLINESFYEPIIVAPTNPSCSTSTSTSPLSDGFTCDASLMVENETVTPWVFKY